MAHRKEKPLTPQQEKACIGVSEGLKQAEVARRLGITAQTMSRWSKNPLFQEKVKQLSTDATKDVLAKLKASLSDNIDIIQHIASTGGEIGVVPSQLRAAMYLVDKIMRPIEKSGGVQMDSGKRAREIVMEVERMSGEEVDDLLFRGTDDDSLVEEFNDTN